MKRAHKYIRNNGQGVISLMELKTKDKAEAKEAYLNRWAY